MRERITKTLEDVRAIKFEEIGWKINSNDVTFFRSNIVDHDAQINCVHSPIFPTLYIPQQICIQMVLDEKDLTFTSMWYSHDFDSLCRLGWK